jgi:hypothetical protein
MTVGGLVGTNRNIIKNCVAANANITATTNNSDEINRIAGYLSGGTCTNNYANSAMVVQNSTGNVTVSSDLNGAAGASKTMEELQQFALYAMASNWNGGAWEISNAYDPLITWRICNEQTLPYLQLEGDLCEAIPVLTGTVSIDGNAVFDETLTANTSGVTVDGEGEVSSPAGIYAGSAIATATILSNTFSETVNGISVELQPSEAGFYAITIADIDIEGIGFPELELDAIQAVETETGYTLSRAGTISFTIPEVTTPPIPPLYPNGTTLYNVPAVMTFTGGAITDNVLTMNISMTATLIPFPPITATVTIEFTGALVSSKTLPPLHYQWKSEEDIVGNDSPAYRIVQSDIGKTITVTVTAEDCEGSVTSEPTDIVTKAEQTSVPAQPVAEYVTTTSITLVAVEGCEYKINGGEFSTNNLFEDLTPDTEYVFTQRYAETDTHFASEPSETARYRTNAEDKFYPVNS